MTISTLNKKGYTTTYCCSGHPFYALNEVYADKIEAFDCIGGMQNILENTNPEYERKYVGKYVMSNNYCYIAFAEPMNFDILPDGFVLAENGKCMTKDYSAKPCSWECVENIVKSMKQLYLWADGLPDGTI